MKADAQAYGAPLTLVCVTAEQRRRLEAECPGRFSWQEDRDGWDYLYRLDRLAVNGGDVLAAGLRPGPAVGQALDILLNAVMDGTLPNERTALLAALQRGFL